MKGIKTLAVLVCIAAITIVATDASAYLHPRLGRFLQRDPLGYVDGMSLYEYVRSGPLGLRDPMGEGDYVTPDGRKISEGESGYFSAERVAEVKRFRRNTQDAVQDEVKRQARLRDLEEKRGEFEAWYREEKAELAKTGWAWDLPACPCSISRLECRPAKEVPFQGGRIRIPATTVTVFDQYDHDKWELSMVSSLGEDVGTWWKLGYTIDYHSGGVYELRQITTGSGQQCVYDKQGELITHGVGAGSADKVGPNHSKFGHFDADVEPFAWALELDGCKRRPKASGLYYRKTLEVRPIDRKNKFNKNPK